MSSKKQDTTTKKAQQKLTKEILDQLYLMNYNINVFVCLYRCHWILAMICLKISWIFILDPLDIDESKYKEFIECIQR
jgi:hypothetical protein